MNKTNNHKILAYMNIAYNHIDIIAHYDFLYRLPHHEKILIGLAVFLSTLHTGFFWKAKRHTTNYKV